MEGVVLVGGGGVVFLRSSVFLLVYPRVGVVVVVVGWLMIFIRGSDLRSECVFCELGNFLESVLNLLMSCVLQA